MKQSDPYKIAIADSQFLITGSLVSLIINSSEYSFAGLVSNVPDLISMLETKRIDLLITDITRIDPDGIKNLEGIIHKNPWVHVLILTNQTNRNELNEFARIGVKNLVYKTADQEEIFSAIDSALKNKKYYSGEVLDFLMVSSYANNERQENFYLTPAEIKMVKLISGGLTTKEIALQLSISFHTVMSHRKNIFRKLNVSSVSELIMYAIRAGLIDNIEYHI
jgi:DNA-binding NarL/FixJ family response regulator